MNDVILILVSMVAATVIGVAISVIIIGSSFRRSMQKSTAILQDENQKTHNAVMDTQALLREKLDELEKEYEIGLNS